MSAHTTTQKRRHVEQYLLELSDDGPVFVKSKFVADDLPLSSREVGTAIGRLQSDSDRLDVEKWSYTNATTWRVEHV